MEAIDLVNRALARLGVEKINNLSDPSLAAKRGLQLYQSTVDTVLRQHPWACAVREVALEAYVVPDWETLTEYSVLDKVISNGIIYQCVTAGTSGATAPSGFADAVQDGTVYWDSFDYVSEEMDTFTSRFHYPQNTVKILSVGSSPYRVYGPIVYTNETEPKATVIRQIKNPDLLDALLQDAVVALLAKNMAPSFGKDKEVENYFAEYLLALQIAKGESSDERTETPAAETYWTERI